MSSKSLRVGGKSNPPQARRFDAVRQARASFFKVAKVDLGSVAAVDPFLPGPAQQGQSLGFLTLPLFHEAKGFPNDLLCGAITIGRDLVLDEFRQLLRERHVHVRVATLLWAVVAVMRKYSDFSHCLKSDRRCAFARTSG